MDDVQHWSLHRDRLRAVLSANRLGIVSDFDGTLSHFVDDAAAASITPENAQALDALRPRVTLVALLSGRSSADLRTRFERPDVVYYGNHGMDFCDGASARVSSAALEWKDLLQALVGVIQHDALQPGVYIENKGITASVHYRAARDPITTRQRLLDRLDPLCAQYGLTLGEGRYVWEIKPPVDINKGSALLALMVYHRLDGVLFLGDDVTDLPAMDTLRRLRRVGPPGDGPVGMRGLSVGVVHPERGPAALREHGDLVANGPDDVARLLCWIAGQLPVATPIG